ncbi:MAG: amidohydrolase family protein, partial [Thermoanaerobaculia bacterium]
QQVVDGELARGCRYVKVYERLTPALYDAVVAAARARNVRVVGHVTRQITLEHALASQHSIEHLSGYDFFRAAELAEKTRAAGVWNCPTLAIIRSSYSASLPPESVEEEMRGRHAMVKALRDAGAPILAGTDSGGGLFDVEGAISAELLELEQAGLTRFEALAAATRDAATFLEMQEIGTLRKGSRADLLLLEANPLESLTALRQITGVTVGGSWQTASGPRRRSINRR